MFKKIYLSLMAVAGILPLFSDPIVCSMAIGPLAIAGIGLGANLLGKAMGGGQQQSAQAPSWLIDMLKSEVRNFRSDDFMVDTEAFGALGEAESQQILSQLPTSMEAFNAEAASRGVFTSGEGISNLYRNVVAPVYGMAETARSRRTMQGEQMRFQGATQAEQLRQQLLKMLAGTIRPEMPNKGFGQQLGDILSEVGSFGTQLGAGQAMGVYPGFGESGQSVPQERVWD